MVALIAGGFVAARTAWWYALDSGMTGSGSMLVDPIEAQLPLAVAVSILVLGIVVLVGRRWQGPDHLVLLGFAVVGVVASPFVLSAYPQPEPATLTGLDPDTGEILWRVELPLNEAFGHRGLENGLLELEGRKDRHGCRPAHRAVVIEAATGNVVNHRELPTFFTDASEIPPPPESLDGLPFVVEQGSTPFFCTA